jgi:ribosome-associated protein
LTRSAVKQRSRALAELLAREAAELKGEDVRVLDVSELLYITDYFVIVTSQSARQTRAIAEGLRAAAKEFAGTKGHEEGAVKSPWVLCDFDTVVAHVLTPEAREFYDLDGLWSDAPQILAPSPGAKVARKA